MHMLAQLTDKQKYYIYICNNAQLRLFPQRGHVGFRCSGCLLAAVPMASPALRLRLLQCLVQ